MKTFTKIALTLALAATGFVSVHGESQAQPPVNLHGLTDQLSSETRQLAEDFRHQYRGSDHYGQLMSQGVQLSRRANLLDAYLCHSHSFQQARSEIREMSWQIDQMRNVLDCVDREFYSRHHGPSFGSGHHSGFVQPTFQARQTLKCMETTLCQLRDTLDNLARWQSPQPPRFGLTTGPNGPSVFIGGNGFALRIGR